MCMFEDICGTGRASASKTHVIEDLRSWIRPRKSGRRYCLLHNIFNSNLKSLGPNLRCIISASIDCSMQSNSRMIRDRILTLMMEKINA